MTRTRKRKVQQQENKGFELGNFSYSSEPETTNYLVPTGIPGVYQSPVEPVDPHNCEQWPESPYCGGNPIGGNPLDRSDFMGIEVEVSANPCEFCFTVSPTLAYLNLPPYVVCRRSDSPECQVLSPEPPEQPDLLPPLPPGDKIQVPRDPDGLNGGCDMEVYGVTILGRVTIEAGLPYFLFDASFEEQTAGTFYVYGPIGPVSAIKVLQAENADLQYWGVRIHCKGLTYPYNNFLPYESGEYKVFSMPYLWTITSRGGIDIRVHIARQDGRLVDVCDTPQPPGRPVSSPPYPNPPPEDCCMSCGESEELLRLIAKRLGTGDYPFAVPQSLLADRGNGQQKLESLSEVFHWFIKQFDAVVGQFPIEIEIKDTDPTKQGDQKEKMTIPNLAEGIAELAGMGLGTNINTNTLINIGIRSMIEAGSAKIEALKGKYISQAIADYLAFDAEETKTNVSLMFTPGKFDLDDILVEQEQKIPLYNYKDDRDFKGEMAELLFAAAIIRSVHYKKVDPLGDVKGDLLNRFKDLLKQVQEKDERGSDTVKSDFSDFIKQVEEGFINTPGVGDALNPYGRNFEQRPKIRELGNTADETSEEL